MTWIWPLLILIVAGWLLQISHAALTRPEAFALMLVAALWFQHCQPVHQRKAFAGTVLNRESAAHPLDGCVRRIDRTASSNAEVVAETTPCAEDVAKPNRRWASCA